MQMTYTVNIDILLASYNGEKFLKKQIDSILAQSNQDWQLLIRDDGSDDNTISIIEDYTARYPAKIKLITDNQGHLGATLNFGKLLEYADNEYIMFSDQDDVWLANKIELTLNAMKAAEEIYPDKPVLVHTDLRVVDADLKTIADSFWALSKISLNTGNNLNKIIYRNVITGCTAMINRKAKEISTPVPPEARVHDWWIALNVAKYGKIVHISIPSVLYRQHPDNVIGAKKSKPMNPGILLKKLYHFVKQFSNDYKVVKKVKPDASAWLLLLNNIRVAIARRFR